MAFGKYTNDYNIRSKASSLSATDEGLRKFMLRVYGYMSAGLAITGVISYLFANAFVSGNAFVEKKLVAEANFTAMMVDK